eukprot:gene10658-12339_t
MTGRPRAGGRGAVNSWAGRRPRTRHSGASKAQEGNMTVVHRDPGAGCTQRAGQRPHAQRARLAATKHQSASRREPEHGPEGATSCAGQRPNDPYERAQRSLRATRTQDGARSGQGSHNVPGQRPEDQKQSGEQGTWVQQPFRRQLPDDHAQRATTRHQIDNHDFEPGSMAGVSTAWRRFQLPDDQEQQAGSTTRATQMASMTCESQIRAGFRPLCVSRQRTRSTQLCSDESHQRASMTGGQDHRGQGLHAEHTLGGNTSDQRATGAAN